MLSLSIHSLFPSWVSSLPLLIHPTPHFIHRLPPTSAFVFPFSTLYFLPCFLPFPLSVISYLSLFSVYHHFLRSLRSFLFHPHAVFPSSSLVPSYSSSVSLFIPPLSPTPVFFFIPFLRTFPLSVHFSSLSSCSLSLLLIHHPFLTPLPSPTSVFSSLLPPLSPVRPCGREGVGSSIDEAWFPVASRGDDTRVMCKL